MASGHHLRLDSSLPCSSEVGMALSSGQRPQILPPLCVGGDEGREGGAAAWQEGSLKFITRVAAFLPVSFSLTSCQLTQSKILKLVNIDTNLYTLKWLQKPEMQIIRSENKNAFKVRGVKPLISGWFQPQLEQLQK